MGLSTDQLVAYKSKGASGMYSGFTQEEAQDKCEAVYEAKGSEAYNKCVPAFLGATNSSQTKKAEKYALALKSGYTGSFDQWKYENLAELGSSVGGFAQGLLSSIQQGGSGGNGNGNNGSYNSKASRNNTALFVVIGLVVVGIGGYILYEKTK